MGANNNLHQVLRSLCFNTHWNYAISWKLKHRARIYVFFMPYMILTWEDAYYDPLGLAVAKMSYHVYLIGEGIVGQVAVTGKHRWICADNQVTGFGSSFEFDDGWQSQFSAGIRTIVVVPVVLLGVVQLGSLNKVIEDMGIVTHIREIFLYNQDYIIGHVPSQMQNSLQSSSSLHVVSSDIMPACFHGTEKIMTSETLDVLLPINNCSLHSAKEKMDTNLTKHEGSEFYSDESSVLLQSISNMKHQECAEMRSMRGRKYEEGRSGCKDMKLELVKNTRPILQLSIDSLLERAIKHMLFLQSLTKHADTKTMLESSSYEQGSSSVMEVGGHLKVHSILVENLSKNGQMLVEMLCEESSHFLDIAEAIRSLDLTILKGSTRSHGEKIWISFVVEGQHNRNVHRLDILWPLVQILQSKASVYSK